MAYITLAGLIDRFGAKEIIQVLNDRTTGTVDEQDLIDFADGDLSPSPDSDLLIIDEIVKKAISDAESLINGYIDAAVSLPLADDEIPEIVEAKCADIARHELRIKQPNAVVRTRYEDAISCLKDIRKGLISLGLTTDGENVAQDAGVAVSSSDNLAPKAFPTKAWQDAYIERRR
jgi:phage gp36-like protein